MMKKILLGGLVAGMMLIGGSVSAQTTGGANDIQSQIQALLLKLADLQAQLRTLPTPPQAPTVFIDPPLHYRICTLLNRNLNVGAHGDDVMSVQEFLQDQQLLNSNPTGFFGPLTARAMQAWQNAHGIDGAGFIGSTTRTRILAWCANPMPMPTTPTSTPPILGCRPVNYMPVACGDGSQPKPVLSEHGCLMKYECPVTNFTPPTNCKAWNDGCNVCTRETASSTPMCTMRACLAAGTLTQENHSITGGANSIWAGKGYCTAYFDGTGVINQPPVVTGFTGPTTLAVNAVGTWTVQAIDPENKTLSYNITWGDQPTPYAALLQLATGGDAFVQTTTFTHSYATAGVYTVTLIVRDDAGSLAKTSMNVQVGSSTTVCTQEYNPVCGQPAEPACRHSNPACMIATPGPQTYSNICMLNAAGATLLYSGACTTNPVACTMEAKQCPDGSYVGHTGANCAFAECPHSIVTTTAPTCIYNGQTYVEGGTYSAVSAHCEFLVGGSATCPSVQYTCHSGQWVTALPSTTASCAAPTGATVVNGQTFTGFCPDYGANCSGSLGTPCTGTTGQGACGLTKLCQNGQWVSGTQTQTSNAPANMPANCRVWQTGGCSGYVRSAVGTTPAPYSGYCEQSLPLATPQCNAYFSTTQTSAVSSVNTSQLASVLTALESALISLNAYFTR